MLYLKWNKSNFFCHLNILANAIQIELCSLYVVHELISVCQYFLIDSNSNNYLNILLNETN